MILFDSSATQNAAGIIKNTDTAMNGAQCATSVYCTLNVTAMAAAVRAVIVANAMIPTIILMSSFIFSLY